jgi:phospholipase C
MADLLDSRSISWNYYAAGKSNPAEYILSAFQAIHHIRFGEDWNNHVVSPNSQVLTDIQRGKLAQVTWIVPQLGYSDHPGKGSTAEGPSWVGNIINAIGASQFWDSTVIFVAWDDWGGWYDHVFALPSLGTRDVNTDDFADCFDYSQSPIPYSAVPVSFTPEHFLQEDPSGPPDDD